jgi:hypothetical protein
MFLIENSNWVDQDQTKGDKIQIMISNLMIYQMFMVDKMIQVSMIIYFDFYFLETNFNQGKR